MANAAKPGPEEKLREAHQYDEALLERVKQDTVGSRTLVCGRGTRYPFPRLALEQSGMTPGTLLSPILMLVTRGTYAGDLSVPAYTTVLAKEPESVTINGNIICADATARVFDVALGDGYTITGGVVEKRALRPANTVVVAASGGDYDTIAEGVAAGAVGDALEIHKGVYSEDVTLTVALSLRAVGNVTIDGDVALPADYTADCVQGAITVASGKTITVGTTTITAPSTGIDLRRAVAGIVSHTWSVGDGQDFADIQAAVDTAEAIADYDEYDSLESITVTFAALEGEETGDGETLRIAALPSLGTTTDVTYEIEVTGGITAGHTELTYTELDPWHIEMATALAWDINNVSFVGLLSATDNLDGTVTITPAAGVTVAVTALEPMPDSHITAVQTDGETTVYGDASHDTPSLRVYPGTYVENVSSNVPVTIACEPGVVIDGDASGLLTIYDAEVTGTVASTVNHINSLRAPVTTLVVGAGEDTQDYVDAAETDCSANKRYVIVVPEGVGNPAWTFADAENAAYISVVNLFQTGEADGPLQEMPGARRVQTYKTKGPALLCLRVDDGDDAILSTSLTALGGESPASYAHKLGVVLDLAVNTAYLNGDRTDATKLTAAEIKTLFRDYGCNISSHAHDHDQDPTTAAWVEQQVVLSAALLRALKDGTDHIGLPCRGWVQPGNWSSAYDLDDLGTAQGYLGQLLRRHYDYSSAVFGHMYSLAGVNRPSGRHMRSATAAIASTAVYATDTALVDNILRGVAQPGRRSVIYIHKPVEAYDAEHNYWITGALYKYLIDSIAALQVAGKLQTVSQDAIYLADFDTPAYDSTGAALERQWGGVYFEEYATGSLVASDWKQGFFYEIQAGDAASIEAAGSGLHTYPDTKSFQILRESTSGTVRAVFQFKARAGSNILAFDFGESAATDGAAQVKLQIIYYGPPYAAGVGTSVAGTERTLVAPSGWERRVVPFGMPTWATDVRAYFNLSAVGAGEQKGLALDNIEVYPV